VNRNKTPLTIKTIPFFLFLILIYLSFPSPANSQTSTINREIRISAAIGEPKLTLFGYTSPQTLVKLEGQQVSEETRANQEGFFLFDQVFLPRPDPLYPELCLISLDQQQRTSFPVCLPPLPPLPFHFSIGPILLPPTLSLDKGFFLPNEQIKAQGMAAPLAKITIHFANQKKSTFPLANLKEKIIPPVNALFLPQYQVQANEQGHFELNLPTNQPHHWRVFASAELLNSPSPKSNTLHFKILTRWEWFWLKIKTFLLGLLAFLKPYLWEIIIISQIIIISLLWRSYRASRKRKLPRIKLLKFLKK